ncbi:MAG: hypothetical protein JO254_06720 [Pseudolabrys sp.]|nr:hypothetical protein [Pseudolabrys sp.]
MADRTALGRIGYLLCGVTALVMLIGASVLNANLSDSEKLVSSSYGVNVTLSAKSH